MRRRRSNAMAPATRLSWKQRVIACLLLVLALFLVINPLWECHDHLDNLRHLGPHGVLLILLLVACAGVSLIKSFRWSALFLPGRMEATLASFAVSRRSAEYAVCAALSSLPPPLRI